MHHYGEVMIERMSEEKWKALTDPEAGAWTNEDIGRLLREARRAREAEIRLVHERDSVLQTERSLVAEFHRAMGVPVLDKPADPGVEARRRRARLILEEALEVVEALGFAVCSGTPEELDSGLYTLEDMGPPTNLHDIAKELADLRYVTLGTELEMGLSVAAPAVFAEVHRSNMTKIGPDGKVVRRTDGKVLKGPNYQPADVAGVLARFA